MPVWVELPTEHGQPAKIRVGDRRREFTNPSFEGLLGIIDEAEKLVRAQAGRAVDRGPLGGGKGGRPSS
jgi:hypothetical protein